jgi:hypothetical protein
VSDEHPGASTEASGDLEYDLAHEVSGVTTPVRPDKEQGEPVVTATPEYDGDYSYDLAHDIPRYQER